MQATARRLSVASATSCARHRLIRDVRPRNSDHNQTSFAEMNLLVCLAQTAPSLVAQPSNIVQGRSFMADIGIGVVSGVVTALLFWLVRALWASVIEPKIYNFVYRGVRIDGTWESSFGNKDEEYSEQVEVTQVGHQVTGVLRVMSGDDVGLVYRFVGEFQHMILSATYQSDSNRSLDRGSFTLKIGKNGAVMRGHSCYYEDETDEISHAAYEWRRPGKASE